VQQPGGAERVQSRLDRVTDERTAAAVGYLPSGWVTDGDVALDRECGDGEYRRVGRRLGSKRPATTTYIYQLTYRPLSAYRHPNVQLPFSRQFPTRRRATFSTSGSSYMNVALTTMHHLYNAPP